MCWVFFFLPEPEEEQTIPEPEEEQTIQNQKKNRQYRTRRRTDNTRTRWTTDNTEPEEEQTIPEPEEEQTIHNQKKNRQYTTRRRKTKSANNDVQNTIQKSKDRATRTHWPGNSDCPGELRWSGKISSSCSTHGSNLQNIWIADLEWQGEYMVDVIISREKTTETARYLA